MMKIVKLFSMAMLCMAVALVSCSGEDGERGPQGSPGAKGEDGIDGVDGQNGTNGEDGVDGNANVQSFKINMDAWNGGEVFEFDMPVAVEDRPNYAFLFYLEYVSGNIVALHPVPGAIVPTYKVVVAYTNEDETPSGVLGFTDHQGAGYQMPPDFYLNLVIIAIEANTTEGKNNAMDLMEELKNAGVDTNDYHAVATYLGLE